METAAGLVKLKPGSEELVDDWRATMTRRCDEALETLRAEGVAVESWFQVDIEGQPYLLWYMRAESIKRVWQVARQSSLEIDAYHFKTMSEITEARIDATPLLDPNSDSGDS